MVFIFFKVIAGSLYGYCNERCGPNPFKHYIIEDNPTGPITIKNKIWRHENVSKSHILIAWFCNKCSVVQRGKRNLMHLRLIYWTSQKLQASFYAVVYMTEYCFGKWSMGVGSKLLFTQSCWEQQYLRVKTIFCTDLDQLYFLLVLYPLGYLCPVFCSMDVIQCVLFAWSLFTCSCHAACWSH